MFCRNCGAQLPDDIKFCNQCGAPQDTDTAGPAPGSAQHTARSREPQGSAHRAAGAQASQRSAQSAGTLVSSEVEQAFRKYITPTKARNCFIVMCVITVPSVVVPVTAMGFAFLTLIFGIIWACTSNRVKKLIAAAKADHTYEQILRDFRDSKAILDGKVNYGEHYIFARRAGRFFNYNDIGWLYRHTMSYVIIPIYADAMIGDNSGKIVSFCKLKLGNEAGGNEIKTLAVILRSKNPNVLLGYDSSTQKEYKSRTSVRR